MAALEIGRLSLRARLTLIASGVVAVALAIGSAVLLVAVRHSVLGSLDESARQQGKDVVALVSTGRLPDPIPIGAGTAGVQVVDVQDRVTAVSAGADRLTSLVDADDLDAVRRGAVSVVQGSRLGTTDELRVVGVAVPGDSRTVLVAVSAAEANGTVHALGAAIVIGGPVLLAGFAIVCWLLVGRSLRPVARLRSGAEAIAAAGSADGRRLPVPVAQDEVRRLAQTLNDMLERLERSSRAQQAFVADAAHELRSPLAAIRTQLEVARAHPDTVEDWGETADGVLADTERLSRLVDDLLLLARVRGTLALPHREGRRGAEPVPVDVSALAGDVAARPGWRVPVRVEAPVGARGGATGGTDPGRSPAAPATVAADPDAVTRVLLNLVDNAARHAVTAVTLGVRLDESGAVEVRVTDDGPGIPEADRDRVFERFTRLDEARSRTSVSGHGSAAASDGAAAAAGEGSGLGLAIVRSLVAADGGTVRFVDPARPPGACVVVTWPAAT